MPLMLNAFPFPQFVKEMGGPDAAAESLQLEILAMWMALV